MVDLKSKIRTIPDFPKPGIQFRDITTLLADPQAFNDVVERFVKHYQDEQIDLVVGIESRGFLIAAPLALSLGIGFQMIRKEGKLPGVTNKFSYDLEYGTDTIELQEDAIKGGERVVLVDDLLATGGTMRAAGDLLIQSNAKLVGGTSLIELTSLKRRNQLIFPFTALLSYN